MANTQSATCGGTIPPSAAASTSVTYTQTWNGSAWAPVTNWIYSAGSCGFTCNTNYTWDGTNTCVENTQSFTCAAKPATGTTWNTVSSYTQTWNGSAWSPTNSTTSYNTIASTTACNYICATGYTWNAGTSSCVSICTP